MKILRAVRFVPRRFKRVLFYLCFAFIVMLFFFFKLWHLKKETQIVLNEKISGIDPFLQYKNLIKRNYLNNAMYEYEQNLVGPGEQGSAFVVDVNDSVAKIKDELYRQNGYDAYISDLISLNRSVKDIRHKECKTLKYIEKLPSVSVIFPFHNEHFSVLMRSVYSIINRSPAEVLNEIVLVDDASSKEALKDFLDQYLIKHNLNKIVTVVRTLKREGLIRARLIGAKVAKSEILVFLDAHSEANYNWLPPLIEPIALNYKTVVCPFVDVIDCDTFEYRAQDEGARGSFDWDFNYKRLPLPEEAIQNPTRPFYNPVMAGGYFAISAKWFWELGGYDEGLDIWGGEQYELSFKVWQCHGKIIDAPCSRVGHIYRCKYVPFPNPGVGDFISRNYRRVADVWMDNYKNYLLERRPEMKKVDPGNLDKQHEVRVRLKCNSFDWFMKEIAYDQNDFYPAIKPLDGAKGQIKNFQTQKCVDTKFGQSGDNLKLMNCSLTAEQEFVLGFQEDIRVLSRSLCFDVSSSNFKTPVKLFACHGMRGNQFFQYHADSKQFYHKISNMCIDCDLKSDYLYMSPCNASSNSQRWEWSFVNTSVLKEWVLKSKTKTIKHFKAMD